MNGLSDQAIADLVALYQDLHRHPELSFAERRTSASVAGWLTSSGYEVFTGVGRTGVVGLLRNGAGPSVLLRADMDGLPVLEEPASPTPAPCGRWTVTASTSPLCTPADTTST